MHEKINIIFMHVFLKDFWREKKGVNEQDTNKIIQNNELPTNILKKTCNFFSKLTWFYHGF